MCASLCDARDPPARVPIRRYSSAHVPERQMSCWPRSLCQMTGFMLKARQGPAAFLCGVVALVSPPLAAAQGPPCLRFCKTMHAATAHVQLRRRHVLSHRDQLIPSFHNYSLAVRRHHGEHMPAPASIEEQERCKRQHLARAARAVRAASILTAPRVHDRKRLVANIRWS